MYTRFYHLHIPKTGGTFFEKNIKEPMRSDLEKNNIISNFEDSDQSIHMCWYKPYIQDSTYIFTIMREPISRLVSQYAWQAKLAVDQGLTNYKYEDIHKHGFFKWFDAHYETYKNYQLKNITYYNPDSAYRKGMHLGWSDNDVPRIYSDVFEGFKVFNPAQSDIKANLSRINLIVKSEDLLDPIKQNEIIDKIASDLGISTSFKIGNTYANQNILSDNIMNSLSKIEINDLSVSLIDEIKVYNGI
jgi:hypothetical protein